VSESAGKQRGYGQKCKPEALLNQHLPYSQIIVPSRTERPRIIANPGPTWWRGHALPLYRPASLEQKTADAALPQPPNSTSLPTRGNTCYLNKTENTSPKGGADAPPKQEPNYSPGTTDLVPHLLLPVPVSSVTFRNCVSGHPPSYRPRPPISVLNLTGCGSQ